MHRPEPTEAAGIWIQIFPPCARETPAVYMYKTYTLYKLCCCVYLRFLMREIEEEKDEEESIRNRERERERNWILSFFSP